MREGLSPKLDVISMITCVLLGLADSAIAEHRIETSILDLETELAQNSLSTTRVTGVQVQTTETGLEIVLQSEDGMLRVPTSEVEGNILIADIPNAVLDLPNGQEFQQSNPASDIKWIRVTNRSVDTVRVAVMGQNSPPLANIRVDAQQLIFQLTSAAEPESPPEKDGDISLDEEPPLTITVTAEKTPEDIQDVPLSITALTEQEIEDADITSLDSIARNTPNFSFFPSGDRSFSQYSIRGLSNTSVIANRDPVDFYLDGVPYGFASFLDLDLPDLERVEVLRGPQNVIYGRNALGGVVNLITRKPSDELEFKGSASYGNFDNLDLKAGISGPLIEDRLFFRLSGNYGVRDGYVRNIFLDNDVNEQSGGNGRAQLLWTPSEQWEIALNASFDDYRDGASSYVPLGQSDPFEAEQNVDGFNNLVANAQSLKVAYTHPKFRFTSITSRRFSRNDLAFDGDYTAADAVVRLIDELSTTVFSQEIRFQSPESAESFEWLVGGYYESNQFNSFDNGFRFGADATAVLGVPFPANTLNLSNSEVNNNAFALFGQVSYRPIDALTLTAGLRYETTNSTLESLDRTISIPGLPDTTFLSLRDVEQDGNEFLPRFAVEYRFTSDIMAYGSINRGYRPPGVNFGPINAATATYDAEQSWNYEVGVKSSWLNERLAVNLAFFHSPINDFQVLLFDELGGALTDNADVSTTGFELEVRATPITGLDIIAGVGFVDAEFTNFVNPFTGVNSSGNKLTFTPNLSYNFAVQYRSPVGIFGRIELQGQGKTFFDDANTLEQTPYALVNARLGYEGKNYGIYFFANNIFDREYINQAFSLPPIGAIASFGAPTTYGLQFKIKF